MVERNESQVYKLLESVEYDIAHIKATILSMESKLQKAKLEKNKEDILKYGRYKSQQERYLKYAKEYRKVIRNSYTEICEAWKKQILESFEEIEND